MSEPSTTSAPSPETIRGLPEHVGYVGAFTKTEYGIFIDRTACGLGYRLVHIATTPEAARTHAARAVGSVDATGPVTADQVFICTRQVSYSPWSTPSRHEAPGT